MGRDAKILSAVAGALLLAAIGIIVYLQVHPTIFGHPQAENVNFSEPQEAPIAAGKMAANFTLTDLKGQKISLSSLRGKVVFLNIWATWCPPCREEMPSIEALYKEFRNNKHFVILAVSQDVNGRVAVAPFVKEHALTFPVLLDPTNEVGEAYGVTGIPETFIIDQQGRIVAHHLGPYNWASHDIREALEDLIHTKES